MIPSPGRGKEVTWQRRSGFLAGKSVYLSPGHGWTWTGSWWTTQRGNSYGIVEDLSNAEAVDQFLVDYLVRAGAHVVPVREIDMTDEMVVCDDELGDTNPEVCVYEEQGDPSLFSDSTLAGYGPLALPLESGINPFEVGGNRLLDTDSTETARFVWTLDVPRTDHYNVYVSYSSYSMRAPDAHYIVRHAGGEDHFRVNQRHMGGTWVFLGRFFFRQGSDPEKGAVILTNDSAHADTDIQVSADAVRLGGGMGLIDRGGGVSGHPRYEESCRYHAQFVGAPSAVYDSSVDGDRTDDVSCRSRLAAWLHEPGDDAVYFSWHTNAGGGTGTSIYIYWPSSHGYCDGTQANPGSRELADLILAEVVGDIRAVWDPDWTDRGRRCAWFGELNPSYNDEMPAALIELAFHDLLEDVEDLREPDFRKFAARAVYQGIVKYFAERDGVEPELLPEPPTNVAVTHEGPCSVEVSWDPAPVDEASGDPAESYLVYLAEGGVPMGAPIDTEGATSLILHDLEPSNVYTVRVSAINAGGESQPSRLLAVRTAGWPAEVEVLVVQGFGRLDSSQLLVRYESSALGDVDRMNIGRMNDGSYILRHGPEIAAYGAPFDSCEDTAVAAGRVDLADYRVVDVLAGRGASRQEPLLPELRRELRRFVESGGRLLISGSHLAGELAGGTAEEQAFLSEVCGVDSVDGDVSYEVSGVSVLEGTWQLEDGYGAAPFYDVAVSDGLVGTESAEDVAIYGASASGVAGINHATAGSGVVTFLAFPFEGIVSDSSRRDVMAQLLGEFEVATQTSDICSAPVEPDGGIDASGLDAGQTECRECRCESNDCSCRLGSRSSPGSRPIWLLGALALGVALLRARRRRCRTSSS
jgi:MYXO-CTERM domain-containing protein